MDCRKSVRRWKCKNLDRRHLQRCSEFDRFGQKTFRKSRSVMFWVKSFLWVSVTSLPVLSFSRLPWRHLIFRSKWSFFIIPSHPHVTFWIKTPLTEQLLRRAPPPTPHLDLFIQPESMSGRPITHCGSRPAASVDIKASFLRTKNIMILSRVRSFIFNVWHIQ